MHNGTWVKGSRLFVNEFRSEWRSAVVAARVIPFSVCVLLVFGFALDLDHTSSASVSAGVLWVTLLLCSLMVGSRVFPSGENSRLIDGYRMTGIDPFSIFLGKSLVSFSLLLMCALFVIPTVVVLFGVQISDMTSLALSILAGLLALGVTATIYGALSSNSRNGETLMGVLALPIVAPVLLASSQATKAAFEGIENGTWLQVVATFAVIFFAVGSLIFESLMEEN